MKLIVPFLLAWLGTSAMAQDVGVSVTVTRPGAYGRIDIGNVPPPVVYAQPVIIAPVRSRREPLYLYVPPGHQKNWSKHCGRYRACGQPVYFVQERWVQDRYSQARGGGDHDHGHPGKGKGPKGGKGKHGDHGHGHH